MNAVKDFECPTCNVNLVLDSEIEIAGFVLAVNDPEGKARFDLILTCNHCCAQFNTFVAVDDFIENPAAVEG